MNDYAKKIDAATRTDAYRAYSEMIGTTLARALLGEPGALDEATDLQKEQAELVRTMVEKP